MSPRRRFRRRDRYSLFKQRTPASGDGEIKAFLIEKFKNKAILPI